MIVIFIFLSLAAFIVACFADACVGEKRRLDEARRKTIQAREEAAEKRAEEAREAHERLMKCLRETDPRPKPEPSEGSEPAARTVVIITTRRRYTSSPIGARDLFF